MRCSLTAQTCFGSARLCYSRRVSTPRLSDEVRHAILNPAPESDLARARDYGIDLTLILANLERTPQERLERGLAAARFGRELRQARRV